MAMVTDNLSSVFFIHSEGEAPNFGFKPGATANLSGTDLTMPTEEDYASPLEMVRFAIRLPKEARDQWTLALMLNTYTITHGNWFQDSISIKGPFANEMTREFADAKGIQDFTNLQNGNEVRQWLGRALHFAGYIPTVIEDQRFELTLPSIDRARLAQEGLS